MIAAALMAVSLGSAFAEPPETGALGPAQAAADLLRTFAATDGALLAAGLLKSGEPKDLASYLVYPTDVPVVMSLTGAQLRQAFERSASLYPEPNAGFLQLSGFEVAFSRTAPAGSRVRTVTVNGSPLDDGRTYSVAMPSSLGRGGLGYFKIWDKNRQARDFSVTLESLLKNRSAGSSASRWSVLP